MALTPERTEVKMADGTTVAFGEKQRMKKAIEIAEGRVSVRFDFRNGEIRTYTLPDELVLQAAGHGLGQKLGDYVAGEKDVDDMVLGIEEIGEQVCSKGEWNSVRESSGNALSGASTLLKALVELTGKDVVYLKDWLSKKTPAEKMALRASEQLQPIIAKIEAAKSKVDTAALLGSI